MENKMEEIRKEIEYLHCKAREYACMVYRSLCEEARVSMINTINGKGIEERNIKKIGGTAWIAQLDMMKRIARTLPTADQQNNLVDLLHCTEDMIGAAARAAGEMQMTVIMGCEVGQYLHDCVSHIAILTIQYAMEVLQTRGYEIILHDGQYIYQLVDAISAADSAGEMLLRGAGDKLRSVCNTIAAIAYLIAAVNDLKVVKDEETEEN